MAHSISPSAPLTREDKINLAKYTGALLFIPSGLVGALAMVLWWFAASDDGFERVVFFLASIAALGAATSIGLRLHRKWAALVLIALMDMGALAVLDLVINAAPTTSAILLGMTLVSGLLTTSAVGALVWRGLRW